MDIVTRFAPTPSGRLHLGNLTCAMLSYLSARSSGGKCLLRIEDLDAYRCAWEDNTRLMIDDLNFLGFAFDGGYEKNEWQSARFEIYEEYFEKLRNMDLIYPCTCSRAELHAATAPHLSDGSYKYEGKCYRYFERGENPPGYPDKKPAMRVHVPDRTISFTDLLQGEYSENLARDCGDFILRRADGVYAYQLAVVVDDGLSGITQVIRGRDLLSSTPRQLWLYELLGLPAPTFCHIPLLTDKDGKRLSKRDGALDIGALRAYFGSPEPIIGMMAYACGLIDRPEGVKLADLVHDFSFDKLPKEDMLLPDPRRLFDR